MNHIQEYHDILLVAITRIGKRYGLDPGAAKTLSAELAGIPFPILKHAAIVDGKLETELAGVFAGNQIIVPTEELPPGTEIHDEPPAPPTRILDGRGEPADDPGQTEAPEPTSGPTDPAPTSGFQPEDPEPKRVIHPPIEAINLAGTRG